MRALRRDRMGGPEQFPRDVVELMGYFGPPEPDPTGTPQLPAYPPPAPSDMIAPPAPPDALP